MRPTALRIARAVVAAVAAATVSAWSVPSATAQAPLTLYPAHEHMVSVVPKAPGKPGRMWAYWGRLNTAAGTPWGSYRATCMWIEREGLPASKSDNRVACTVVIAERDLKGSTLVAEGLVKMPKKVAGKTPGLFDRAKECSSAAPPKPQKCTSRQLAITGATGALAFMRGFVVGLVEGPNKTTVLAIGPPT